MRDAFHQRPPVRAERGPSAGDRASRPRGRRRTAGRAPAGSPASAASQRIAGPMRLSSARSGPTRKGHMVTTTRKNSTPISAPPPTRTAMRMSRTRRAASALTAFGLRGSAAWSSRSSCVAPCPAARGVAARMRPPSARCARIKPARRSCADGIERAGRFVEQPDRPFDGKSRAIESRRRWPAER